MSHLIAGGAFFTSATWPFGGPQTIRSNKSEAPFGASARSEKSIFLVATGPNPAGCSPIATLTLLGTR